MYRKQSNENQNQIQFVCLDDLVPKDHILREIDKAIDFSFIYDEVAGLNSALEKEGKGYFTQKSCFIPYFV